MDPTLHSYGYAAALFVLVYQVLRWAYKLAEEERLADDSDSE